MKRLLLACCLSMVALGLQAAPPAGGEYVLLVGGPSMYQWEKYKAVPARSLVGELCAGGAFAHRTIARAARAGCEDYLARLQAGLRGSRKTGAPGSDQSNWYRSRQIQYQSGLVWPGHEVIDYLNNGQPRDQVKIVGFRIFRAFEPGVFHVRLQQQHRQRV